MKDDRSVAQQFLTWRKPIFKAEEWEKASFSEKILIFHKSWAAIGYGTPLIIISFYILKMWLYLWVWSIFCRKSLANVSEWAFDRDAFTKILLWSISFENIGLGCSSGPLSGKFSPPFTSIQHWLRVGSYRTSYFVDHPNTVLRTLFGGNRRSIIDVLAVIALHFFIYRALLKSTPILSQDIIPVIIVIALEGLRDRAFFLSTREEHYWAMLIGLLAPQAAGIGAIKIVSAGIWFYAGLSKVNPHFAYAIMTMIANHPFVPYFVRRLMYRNYQSDFRPSIVAKFLAHATTALELGGTILLLILPADSLLYRAVVFAYLLLHINIILSVPAAVPNEWNLVMLYQLGFLWKYHANVSVLAAFDSPSIAAIVILSAVIVPLYGNIRPDQISFLSAMRYYAGNWCYGIVVFTDGYDAFMQRVKEARASGKFYTSSDLDLRASLRSLKLPTETEQYIMLSPANFVLAHLHTRGVHRILAKHVPAALFAKSYVNMGDMMQTWMTGWSFGDGHHGAPDMWREFTTALGYKPKEAYFIVVEGVPLFGSTHQSTLYDAAGAVVSSDTIAVADVLKLQPNGSITAN